MHAAAAELGRRGAFVAVLLAAGCSSMQRVSVDYINVEKPAVVHLANSYGIVTTLQHPTLNGDTVRGVAVGHTESVAVPLGQVESISTVRFSTGRTVALVAGATGVTALMAYAMFGSSSGDENWYCDYGVKDENTHVGPQCGPKR